MPRSIGLLTAIIAIPSTGMDSFRVTQCLLGGAAVGVLWGILQTDPPKDQQPGEGKKLKGARSLCGFAGGLGGPLFGDHYHWWSIGEFHPALIVVFGMLCAAVSYFILHTILRLVGKRESDISAKAVKRMLERADKGDPQ